MRFRPRARPSPLAQLALRLGVLACSVCGCSAPESASEPDPRPNIVFILTDDQTSSTLPHMPEVNARLVEEGARFERFFVNDPVCCPARITFFTGEHLHQHRVETSEDGCAHRFFTEGRHRTAAPALLRAAGYHTGLVGKYLNSHFEYLKRVPADAPENVLEGWDDYHAIVTPQYYRFTLHENGRLYRNESGVHQTDALAGMATSFVRLAPRDRPLFLYVGTGAPHEKMVAAERHRDRFPDARAPRPPSFDEADVRDKPFLRGRPRLPAVEIAKLDAVYRSMLEGLLGVDELVGAVLDALEQTGRLENTWIFYTSDNGYHFGEHRVARGKGTPYEESVRVPLVVRGPGVAAGTSVRELAINADLLPTFLEIAGAIAPDPVAGRSLLPLFDGAADPVWRTAVVLGSVSGNRNHGIPGFTAIRTDRYKLIEYPKRKREIYDLAGDPHELENLAGRGDGVLDALLAKRLRALLACEGAGCRRAEDASAP